jgi:hypothetical protein
LSRPLITVVTVAAVAAPETASDAAKAATPSKVAITLFRNISTPFGRSIRRYEAALIAL